MIKADDTIKFDNDGKEEESCYTNFELLQKKVEVLQRIIDEHAEILIQHNLQKIKKTDAPYFDDDKVYEELENENDK